MKKTTWIVIVVVIIILGLVWRNHSKTPVADGEIFKIGVALPVTGVYASFGEEFQRGAEIAQDEINQNGGSVKVYVEDTSLESKKALDAVNKLVSANDVDAVIVSAFLEAAASHQITDAKNLPMLVLWDSNPQLEAMGNNVFAIGPWTPASGEVTANFARQKGATKAAIFGDKQEWSVAVTQAFADTFKKAGGQVADMEYVSPGTKDYKAQISKLLATNPDVLYMTPEDFFVAVKQARDLGYKGLIVNSDLLDNSLIVQQPDLFEGVYSSQVADPEASKTAHFIDLYKKKFGEAPKKLLYGTWGYDGVQVLYAAHVKAGSGSVSDALYKLDTYNGASGDIKFDANGTSKTIPKMFVVKNGEIVRADQ